VTDSRWRAHARPIIERVLSETAGQPEAEVKRALRDAYPFGARQYHPYKVWLDEIRRQRGGPQAKARKGTPKRAQQDAAERTLSLFGGAE
jgi:hypothetical protein